MPSRLSIAYIAFTIAAGVAVLANGVSAWASADHARYFTFLLIAVAGSGLKVRLPSVFCTLSLSFVFVLIGVAEFDLGETLVMGVLAALVQSFFHAANRPRPVQVVFSAAGMECSIQFAWVVHGAFHSLAVTALAFFVANTLMVAAVIALTEGRNLWEVWRGSYFWSFPNYLVGAGAAWIIDATGRSFGWQGTLLLLPILFVVYRSHSMYVGSLREAKERAEQQQAHAEEVAALHRRTIETLALAIEAKDQTTADHLQRVEIYAVEVAKELALGEREIEALRAAALLHDIGKLAVPEYIVSKPGKLTPEEFEKMKTHTVVGAEIVERIRFPYAVAPMVRGHHERWNGTGYPDGLSGEDIPVGARILAAVDCLDALVSDRQYRRALPLAEAIKVIEGEAGKSFDPRVAGILLRRHVELERLANSETRIASLSTAGTKVERGDAPAAGFERTADPQRSSRDLLNLNASVSGPETETRALSELLSGLRTCQDRDAVFAALRTCFSGIVPYDAMVVYLRQGDCLVPVFLDGVDFDLFVSLRIPMGAGLSGWVAENNKAIVNGNPSVEPGYLNDPRRFSTLGSALSVPLNAGNGVLGVLSLYLRSHDAFTTGQLGALTALSSTLASALERSVPLAPSR